MNGQTIVDDQIRLSTRPRPGVGDPDLTWRFVVLEGLDGSGKTTVAKGMAARTGARYLATPVPELSLYRKAIDAVVGERGLARTLWYLTHVALVARQVSAILEAGGRVVVDRYWLSTLAYAAAQGFPLCADDIVAALPAPDATVLLRVPMSLRKARAASRTTGFQPHDIEFFDARKEHRLYEHYRRLGTHPAAGRFIELTPGNNTVEQDVDLVLDALTRNLDSTPTA